jgi:hypothetical protein
MPTACHGWCCITSVSFTTLAVLSKMVFIKQMDFLSKMMLFTPFFFGQLVAIDAFREENRANAKFIFSMSKMPLYSSHIVVW